MCLALKNGQCKGQALGSVTQSLLAIVEDTAYEGSIVCHNKLNVPLWANVYDMATVSKLSDLHDVLKSGRSA